MPTIDDPLAEILEADKRYSRQAYLFLHEALGFTVVMLGLDGPGVEDRHVSGQQLLEGLRRFGLQQFGYLCKTVFESWGVKRTQDWGEIVFNMVEGKLMNKTEQDRAEDFADVYEFRDALERAYFRDQLYRDEPSVYEATSTIALPSAEDADDDDEQASASHDEDRAHDNGNGSTSGDGGESNRGDEPTSNGDGPSTTHDT